MCTSLRGAAFFGASIHIAVGLLLFSRYVIATVVFTFYNFNDFFSEKVTAFIAPFMIYVTLLLALGLVIFHSVEKECFFLLKWSSVAFSLLQLAVFLMILLLKLSPNYQYHQFPFLPDSLTNWYPSSMDSSIPPAGPGTGILTVPHGTVLTEKEKSKSSDPPDPGGSSTSTSGRSSVGSSGRSSMSSSTDPEAELRWREGLLLEIQRLSILISCVLLTLVYLLFLFLYIRQLRYEDTGHVFGHAQAITRNIAFYVQPQFSGQQGNVDNNKLIGQVQRSQTQIPQQFLPTQQQQQQQLQLQQQQINQSPKKVPPLHQNQVQSTPSTATGNPGELTDVQRSPARQRGQLQPQQDRNNPQNLQISQHNQNQTLPGNFPLMNQPKLGHLGPSTGQQLPQQPRGVSAGQLVDSPGQQGHVFGPRGPIPAQVRLNFYPKDLIRQNPGETSPVGLPINNIRPPRGSGGEAELRGEEFPLHPQQQQQLPQPPPHQYQQQQHQQAQHPQGHHPQAQHPQGQPSLGQHPVSQHPQGQHPIVQHPMSQHSGGHYPPDQQHPHGQFSQGPNPQAQHPQGHHLHGPHLQGGHPQGPHPPGQHLQGPHPSGHHLQGPHPPGHHLQGPHPPGHHLQGPHPPGHHLQGPHLQGQHSQGPNPHQFQRLQYHQGPHQQQLLHHSYPNQSDSASPASSVTYSPNPPPRDPFPRSTPISTKK